MDAMGVRLDLHMNGDYLTPMAQTVRAAASATIAGGVALVCGFKYLASEKSREPVGGDAAQALATCPDSAVAIEIGTTDMDNAIAIDNDSLRMGEATRTLTGDHESRVTDTGTSIVQTFCKTGHAVNAQGDGEKYASSSSSSTLNTFENHTDGRAVDIVVSPAVCKTLSAEGFDGMPDIQKGNGMPVVAIDGNKLCKNERAGGSGLGVSTAGVMYTETACDNKHHAVAVRTANTHANGHGVAEEATHTLDRASGQAVAVGFKAGQSANGGLGIEEEVCPTQSHQPSALEPTVAIGCDRRNQSGADEVQPALQSTVSDGGSTVAIGVDAYNQAVTGGASKPLGHSATDTDHTPAVALNHIVRRLTPVECERLQGFPDWWVRIPVDKWRKIDRDEYDYLAGLGAWYREHIRETGKPGVWETDLSSDSPAYKALGNSWATNCAEWILRRIVAAFRLDMIPEVSP